MTGRRVILHAGLHKTVTTTARKFLYADDKHIWPRGALVLPNRLRRGAAGMAVRYCHQTLTHAKLDLLGKAHP